jgi:hypothetical protein
MCWPSLLPSAHRRIGIRGRKAAEAVPEPFYKRQKPTTVA